MAVIEYTGRLVTTVCWCGMAHAVPEYLNDYQQRCHDNGREVPNIYCPLGHGHVPAGDGKAARLKRQLETSERRRRAEYDLRVDTERRLSAQKAATTRAKHRHAAGVCPCCKRTFQQLARHMATKHPDYDPAK